MATVSVEYLLPMLRVRIGDLNSESYRYMDEWLLVSLIASIRGLERYWGSKYFVTDGGEVTRNASYTQFEFSEDSGVIQTKDEEIIVIKAALIILEGSLENSAWAIGSWKDAEISYSNIQAGNLRGDTIKRLREELASLIKSPMKRLTRGSRQSLLEEVAYTEVVPEDFNKSIIL